MEEEVTTSLAESESAMVSRLSEKRGGRISDIFGRFGFSTAFSEDPDKVAMVCIKISNFARNLALIHGMPQPFQVKFASNFALALVGFDSVLKSNIITLGSKAIEDKLPMSDLMEIYGGFVIHESEHAISTPRSFDTWRQTQQKLALETEVSEPELSFQYKCEEACAMLMEDVRIERLAVNRSPGFDGYLIKTREWVFKGAVERAEENFKDMLPRSKFMSIMTLALKVPHMVPKSMKEFVVDGICPFDVLSKIHCKLVTNADSIKIAKLVTAVIMRLSNPDKESKMGDDVKELGEKAGVSKDDMEKATRKPDSKPKTDSAEKKDDKETPKPKPPTEPDKSSATECTPEESSEETNPDEPEGSKDESDRSGKESEHADSDTRDDGEDLDEESSGSGDDDDESNESSEETGESGSGSDAQSESGSDSSESEGDGDSGESSDSSGESSGSSTGEGGTECGSGSSKSGGKSSMGEHSDKHISDDPPTGTDESGATEPSSLPKEEGKGGEESLDGEKTESKESKDDVREKTPEELAKEKKELSERLRKELRTDSALIEENIRLKKDTRRRLDESAIDVLSGRTRDSEITHAVLDSDKIKITERTLEKSKSDLEKTKEGRDEFGVSDILDLVVKSGSHDEGISASVMESLEKLEEEHFESDDSWVKGDKLFRDREIAIKQPKMDTKSIQRFEAASQVVLPFVSKAGNLFRLRKAEETRRAVDKKQGGLLRKRLATAGAGNERLFCKKETYKAVGISVCILLDESGSMGSVCPSRLREAVGAKEKYLGGSDEALCLGVMLQKALEKVPKIDLHIYSHESYGANEENCLIKHLYGGVRKDRMGLGTYHGGNQNYDHAAIRVTGQQFLKHAKHDRKVFFCIADGTPCGVDYGGEPAITATAKEVKVLEKKGILMVGLGVGGHDPSDMFKNSIPFNGDFPHLISCVQKIIGKQVLGAGSEKVS